MTDSQRLLADYVTNGSEPAFRELVTRYVDLVYSAAVRLVGGDTHLAQDVAQTVFVDLARKARTLPRDVMLGGWLHRDTCFVASKAMRGERRRQFRERQAVAMNEIPDHSEANLARVAPILDEAINQLGEEDRTAIVMRFFEQRDLRSVGEALGSSENAAQKRVSRALEELRMLLKHRGIAFSAVALGTALAGETVTAVPAGLAVTISNTALAGAVAGTGTTLTLLKFMTMTNFKLGIGALVAAGAITTFVIQRQAQEKLRGENESLRQQITQLQSDKESLSRRASPATPTPHLPAPQMQAAPRPADLQSTNLYLQLRKDGKVPKLTAEQVEAYLKSNQRNAAINDISTPEMLDFCQRQYKDLWQKRFAEDLAMVLADMGHPINAEHMVSLTLIDSKTGERKSIERANMTKENRQAINAALNRSEIGKPSN
jgi:RNA polymerase sigma factor (sigma-70 family)